MQRVSSGYTIIEVMIVLGVSAVVAGSAMTLISGKQRETDFNQKMRDTQSKIQDWINDVSTGQTGGDPTTQTCLAPGNSRPRIVDIKPTKTYSPECTFLGKAIQFTDVNNSGTAQNQKENLYAYSVFGRREITNNSNQLPTNMDEARPDAASGGSSSDLTQTFSMSPAFVKSTCAIPQGSSACTSDHLIGFMNSFNTEQNTAYNGSVDLNAYQYPYNGNGQPRNNQLVKCLQGSNPCSFDPVTSNPRSLKEFRACLTDGRRTAQISITSSGGVGASVKLEYLAC